MIFRRGATTATSDITAMWSIAPQPLQVTSPPCGVYSTLTFKGLRRNSRDCGKFYPLAKLNFMDSFCLYLLGMATLFTEMKEKAATGKR